MTITYALLLTAVVVLLLHIWVRHPRCQECSARAMPHVTLALVRARRETDALIDRAMDLEDKADDLKDDVERLTLRNLELEAQLALSKPQHDRSEPQRLQPSEDK